MPPVLELAAVLGAFLPRSIGPYIGLMLGGFVIAVLGHIGRSRWMVTIGVLMVFTATFLFPLAINLTDTKPDIPGYPDGP